MNCSHTIGIATAIFSPFFNSLLFNGSPPLWFTFFDWFDFMWVAFFNVFVLEPFAVVLVGFLSLEVFVVVLIFKFKRSTQPQCHSCLLLSSPGSETFSIDQEAVVGKYWCLHSIVLASPVTNRFNFRRQRKNCIFISIPWLGWPRIWSPVND